MKNTWILGFTLAGCLAAASPLLAQSGLPSQTVVTIMPGNGAEVPAIAASQVQASVDGKRSPVVGWTPLHGAQAGLQIVILLDNSARSSLSLQFGDLKKFISGLPEGTQVGLAYMQNGNPILAQNLTADRARVGAALRLPNGSPGGSPYFSLSSLVKNWPSADRAARREVLMVTDGVDAYNGRRFDPSDPYVQSAISDAQKAGVIVHSIFYRDTGRFDSGDAAVGGAQSYLLQVSENTGGRAYFIGTGNPVSFAPFLDDLHTRLENQYELGLLVTPRNRPQLVSLKVKVTATRLKVDAPSMVLAPGNERAR